MSRHRRQQVNTQEAPVTHREPEVVPQVREEIPIVEAASVACPRCGSYRSRMMFSKPGKDGRMTHRKCKACLQPFKVWDAKRQDA